MKTNGSIYVAAVFAVLLSAATFPLTAATDPDAKVEAIFAKYTSSTPGCAV